MKSAVGFALIVLPVLGLGATADGPTLGLELPGRIQIGHPFTVALTVTNDTGSAFYFKRPWKWASNGLLLRAISEDGQVVESATRLYDIETAQRCTFFKPVRPAESFMFRIVLNEGDFRPELPFPKPGRYRVTWVYHAKHYEDEASCTTGGWPIWRGEAESPGIDVVVE